MQFCESAISSSTNSTHTSFQHGALLVRGNIILESGYNNHNQHAEIDVITKYIFRVLQGREKKASNLKKLHRELSRSDLIVVRLKMNNSKPCKNCLEFIKKCGIRRIYYSDNQTLKMERSYKMETNHVCSRSKWINNI